MPDIWIMADYLWIEKYETYTGVGELTAQEVMENAPLAYKCDKKKNTTPKGY